MSELGIFYPKNPPEIYTENFTGTLLNPFGTVEKFESIARSFTGNNEWCKLTFGIEGVNNNIPLTLMSTFVIGNFVGLRWTICVPSFDGSVALLSAFITSSYNTTDKVWDGDPFGVGLANVFNPKNKRMGCWTNDKY